MTNPQSVASLDVAKIKRVDSIEAMLRKHMQMYDWTRSEARAINDFILTVREGVADDVAGALAAENERLAEVERELCAQVCENRAESLHEGGQHTASNEGSKCAMAIRRRLAPNPLAAALTSWRQIDG